MPVKVLLAALFLVQSAQLVFGQAGVTFSRLPADYQLFARDSTNQATIVLEGAATMAGPDSLSVELWREGKWLSRSGVRLAASRPASFSSSVRIRAEKAQYAIRIYAHTGSDSTLVAERSRLVCGDFIQIYGQSNGVAFSPNYPFDDTYLRNFAFTAGSAPTEGQVSWYPAKQPYGGSGLIGWRLQELILERFGIPTCIMNGAIGGESIHFLGYRNGNNPADLTTAYGQLLYRHQRAQAIPALRAIIWKQGETEAGGAFKDAAYYSQEFDQLYKGWRQDYGPKPRIYLSQVNYLPDHNPKAGEIRDFQRRTKTLYPNLETIATVGTTGFEGIHYSPDGYLQTANELFRQLARDLYQSADTLQINSPAIQKAYYNTRRDTLTMVFNDRMQMVWPKDSTLNDLNTGEAYQRRMKDFIYLDGQAGTISSGTANQNRVVLALTFPVSAKSVTYLPPFFEDAHTTFYNGVHLKNTQGMRAFSFEGVTIGNALPAVSLKAADLLADNRVKLLWDAPSVLPVTYELERADSLNGPYVLVGRTSGQTTTFIDTTLSLQGRVVYYRLRASSTTAESPASAALRLQTANLERADLQLAMQTSARVSALGAPVRVMLTLKNNGPSTATQVVVENRLPPNSTFVAGSPVGYSSGVVSATASSLTVGQAVSWTYVVSAQKPGRYLNAAQVLLSPLPDPDSTPGSGTADGEDDMATADFRTVPSADSLYTSPNPNQRLLAPVKPNTSVAAVPDKADLSLRMISSSLTPTLNDVVSFTLAVSNAGGAMAKTITVVDELPKELEVADASGWQQNGNLLSIELTSLAPGEERILVFTAKTIGPNPILNKAEISRAVPDDPDSTPGNGTANGEDDTAQVLLRVR